MSRTIVIEDKNLTQQLGALHDALIGAGQTGDAATLIKDESRRLVKQAIKFTPPKTLAQGRNRIALDMGKLFSGLKPGMIRALQRARGHSSNEAWITTRDGKKLRVRFEAIDPAGHGMAKFHRAHRDRRGRARTAKRASKTVWNAGYIVSERALKQFTRRQQAKVGLMRGAWLPAYHQLGGRGSSWFERHAASGLGHGTSNLTGTKPTVTIQNGAPGIARFRSTFRRVLAARGEAISKRVRLILSGYSRDVARGIRPRKKVRIDPSTATVT